ncbi:uncharacterized protein LOC135220811 [Macrobrachium nipponense]|uniref:uncharacterized protein LOC135220811 n=1 Tax=Macrobrachium nipponense TaxID=159736 RepID=UPI0030C7C73A
MWMAWRKTLFLMIALLVRRNEARDERGIEHLARCIKMAEPLVQTPGYIFPLTVAEIRSVCRMWDGFVDCVNEYTATYLSPTQKHEFNQAIRSSIESIQQLCAGDYDYQRSYLAYAPCLKRVSTDSAFCNDQYQYLADLVQGSAATDAQLCCAHHKFRDCVLEKTPMECDKEGVAAGSNMPASRFMRDMLDRALGFLLQKCRDFVPNSHDCPRTNVRPSVTTADTSDNNGGDDFFSNINDGENNNEDNLGNNIYLRPDSTTSRQSSTTPPDSTTRFTWTTKASGLATPDPTDHLSGNNLEPESQQYRGGASATFGNIISIVLVVGLTTVLKLQ